MCNEIRSANWKELVRINDYVLIKLLVNITCYHENEVQANMLADCLEDIGFQGENTLEILRDSRQFSSATAGVRLAVDNIYGIYAYADDIHHGKPRNFYSYFRKEEQHA